MPSEIPLWLWLLPRRILTRPRLLPYGCARGCHLGVGVGSSSQGAGATLGSHQFPSFSLPLPSLLWELSSGHPGRYRAPPILSTEGRPRGVGQGWPGSLPTPPPSHVPVHPLTHWSKWDCFQTCTWTSPSTDLGITPVHHPACPHTAPATCLLAPHAWPAFSTVPSARPGSSQGPFGTTVVSVTLCPL